MTPFSLFGDRVLEVIGRKYYIRSLPTFLSCLTYFIGLFAQRRPQTQADFVAGDERVNEHPFLTR